MLLNSARAPADDGYVSSDHDTVTIFASYLG
jgi:hypothetical protein